MQLSMDLCQALFAYLHMSAADRSNPEAALARKLAKRIWTEAGHQGNPMDQSPCNFGMPTGGQR